MNFALELFLNATAMIFFIVVVGEIIWKLQRYFGGEK
jgi:hypothetical protein